MARGDQLARLLRIVQTLASTRGGVTVGELAREEDCSPRTIYRDLSALEKAGFPLYKEETGRSLWKFVDGYRLHTPIPFAPDELMALYYSRGLFRYFEGTVFSDAFDRLSKKIIASLSEETRNLVEHFENVLEFGLKPKKDFSRHREILHQVNKACSERRRVEMVYYTFSRDQETRRRLDPYRIWYYDGALYVVGFCHLRQQVRMFALDRIRLLNVTDQAFEPPKDFSMEKFTANSFGIIQDELVEVRIRFTGEAARWILDRTWHPSQKIEQKRSGRVTVSYRVAGTSEIKRWILGFGSQAEVLEPESLRREISTDALLLSRLYAEAGQEEPPSRPEQKRTRERGRR